jgi:hypothetical protein
MNNFELTKQLDRIRALLQRVKEAGFEDLELQGHWGKYLCILVAGFMENAVAEVYTDFVRCASSKPVQDFSSAVLRRIRNPKAKAFVETARAFNPLWAAELEHYLGSDDRAEALDSIMNNRNLIAHGRSSGITITQVSNHLRRCVDIVEFIEKQCKGRAR